MHVQAAEEAKKAADRAAVDAKKAAERRAADAKRAVKSIPGGRGAGATFVTQCASHMPGTPFKQQAWRGGGGQA